MAGRFAGATDAGGEAMTADKRYEELTMPIDHAEALQRGREYWIRNGQMYAGMKCAELVAAEIEQAVRDTALECSEICRRQADRAPGGLLPVGVGARASDEIRHVFGL